LAGILIRAHCLCVPNSASLASIVVRSEMRGRAIDPLVRFMSGYDPPGCADPCPLSGVKRTSRGHELMSAFDPKRK
jgi:hypothetical protein